MMTFSYLRSVSCHEPVRRPVWCLALWVFVGAGFTICGCGCGQRDILGTVADGGTVSDAGPDVRGPIPKATDCAGAAQWFGQALCVCEQASILGDLSTTTLGGDSGAAHVAALGSLQASGFVGPVDGDMRLAGDAVSVLSAENGQIAGDLVIDGPLAFDGVLSVAGNLWALGSITGTGEALVAGDLLVPGKNAVAPAAVTDFTVLRAPDMQMPVPSCLCDKKARLDVKKVVMAQRGILEGQEGDRQALQSTLVTPGAAVDIPPGAHWIESLHNAGTLTLRVTGKSALFMYGDFTVEGDLIVEINEGAELSLFVAGNVTLGGAVSLAPPERATAGRLYVSGSLSMAGQYASTGNPGEPWRGAGYIYAPHGVVTWSGHTRWAGALYLQSLIALGGLELSYDPGIRGRGELCDGP